MMRPLPEASSWCLRNYPGSLPCSDSVLCVLALSFANAVRHQGKLTCYFDYVSRLISTYVEDSTSYASFGFNWKGQHRYRLGLMQGRGDIPIKTSCSEPSQY